MFYSVKKCCELLDVSRATLYREIRECNFPKPIKITKRRKGVPKEDFDLWRRITIKVAEAKALAELAEPL